jgi:hypothetical protein
MTLYEGSQDTSKPGYSPYSEPKTYQQKVLTRLTVIAVSTGILAGFAVIGAVAQIVGVILTH